jgi:hypothetical protein
MLVSFKNKPLFTFILFFFFFCFIPSQKQTLFLPLTAQTKNMTLSSSSSSLSFTISNTSQSNINNTIPSLNTFCSITLNNNNSFNKTHHFRIHCINQGPLSPLQLSKSDHSSIGGNDGGDDDGGGDNINGGGNGDGGGEGEEEEGDEEFGPLLNFEAVMKEAEAHGVKLPSDMEEAARFTGIRQMFLLRYLELQVGFYKKFSFLMFVLFFY